MTYGYEGCGLLELGANFCEDAVQRRSEEGFHLLTEHRSESNDIPRDFISLLTQSGRGNHVLASTSYRRDYGGGG